MIPRYPNLAGDNDDTEDVVRDWCPLIRRTRRERHLLNLQWYRYDNIWNARPDAQAYHGRVGTYLTVGRRVIENWVTKLKQDLFPPSGKWVAITSATVQGEDQITVLDALYKRYLVEMIQLRRKLTPWLRTLVSIGTAPMDIGWKTHEEDVPMLRAVMTNGRRSIEERVETVLRYAGPTVRLIPPWRWYVYPPNVNDMNECSLIFEDFLMDPRQLAYLAETPISSLDAKLGMQAVNVDAAMQLLPKPGSKQFSDRFLELQRLMAARGLSSPWQGQDDPHPVLVMTKAYIKGQFQNEPLPAWYQVLIAFDDVICQLRKVPHLYGTPSYLCGKFLEKEEDFYGYGVCSSIDTLQYLANDLMNQSADGLVWGINPIVGVDPDAVQDMTSLRMKPAAKWLVRRPQQSIMPIAIPVEGAIAGQQAVQQMIGLINDTANVQPYSGNMSNRGRAVQTATGASIVSNEALVQVADITEGVEDHVLNPMMRRFYDLTIQCLEQPMSVMVAGAAGASFVERQVTRDDVIGDYSFQWLASTSAYNQQVRAQQLIGFTQILARIPPQLLQQQNCQVDWKYLLRGIWSMGFQLPEPERVIVEAQPVRAVDPQIENDLFESGRGDEVSVSPADNDDKHLREHEPLLAPKVLDDQTQAMVAQHVQQHLIAKMAKQIMAQQQAMAQQAQMMGLGGGNGQQPGDGSGNGGMGGGPAGLLPSPDGSGALAMPDAPGRIAATSGMDDILRRMPRGGGPGGVPGGSPTMGGY